MQQGLQPFALIGKLEDEQVLKYTEWDQATYDASMSLRSGLREKSLPGVSMMRQAWHFEAKLSAFPDRLCSSGNRISRNVGGSNLLRDASCLPFLNARPPDVVQQLCLACKEDCMQWEYYIQNHALVMRSSNLICLHSTEHKEGTLIVKIWDRSSEKVICNKWLAIIASIKARWLQWAMFQSPEALWAEVSAFYLYQHDPIYSRWEIAGRLLCLPV